MILIDPDLEPDPLPRPSAAKRPPAAKAPIAAKQLAAPNSNPADRSARIPSVRSLTIFLGRAQAAVRLRGQVTVLLTTDTALRNLNRRFRGKNKPTDVLSFPAQGPAAAELAGDLAISIPTARRQALALGHTLAAELKILILHGLLHLAGYDHESDSGEMARREYLLRSHLNLPLGLIERASSLALSTERTRRNGAPRQLRPGRATADPSTPLRSAQDDKQNLGAQDDKARRGKRLGRSKRV